MIVLLIETNDVTYWINKKHDINFILLSYQYHQSNQKHKIKFPFKHNFSSFLRVERTLLFDNVETIMSDI